MRILVVNVGSSSVKLRVLDDGDRVVSSSDLPAVDDLGSSVIAAALGDLGPVDAVGHRIVHGGPRFTAPTLVDDTVRDELGALCALAPLHQPPALSVLDALRRHLPGVPHVACFDTAFHAGLPAEASTYALPEEWNRTYGLRRYGFHGLSHAYAARRAGELLPAASPKELRVVTCHLGAGASLAAVRGGRSMDTTMGFTPLEGLVMATRAGSVDPGLVLWLQTNAGLSPEELNDGLEHRSGIAGLTGSPDMALLIAHARQAEPRATLALGVYLHRLRAGIAAMAASLGGLHALVFTGGVGEGAPAVRAGAVGGLGFLDIALDERANSSAVPDCDVSAPGAGVRTFVVHAREDLEIAAGVRGVVEEHRRSP